MVDIEFEIIKIEDKGHRFVVEYEFTETRERKTHGFPKGNGWMEKRPNGEYKFIREIKRIIARQNEAILETEKVCNCDMELKNSKVKVTSNDLNL